MMIPCKLAFKKPILFLFSLLVFSWFNSSAQDINAGKTTFQQNCASCHNIFKQITGPALEHLEDRGSWADHAKLLEWIHNSDDYANKDAYAKNLKFTQFGGQQMQHFPELTLKDVDNIVAYINDEVKKAEEGPKEGPKETKPETSNNAIIFGV